MISAFGIDHGEGIAKANKVYKPSSGNASTGRQVAAHFGGSVLHGGIAGRPGYKMKAIGHEFVGAGVGAGAGGTAGGLVGAGVGAAFHNPRAGALVGGIGGAGVGRVVGRAKGVNMANRKGYYKAEPKQR